MADPMTAPAAMPGEAIFEILDGVARGQLSPINSVERIESLFAPILAEKERVAEDRFKWYTEAQDQKYRALAAEDALAAERERAAKAAEGPEFWPYPKQPGDVLTYRGTKDGNWLAVKPPFKLDPYSQGRADAAAAIRAQGE